MPNGQPLRFAVKVKLFLGMRGLTFAQAAKASGLDIERFEDLMAGQHVPLAPDVLRLMDGLGIQLTADDFENRGLTL